MKFLAAAFVIAQAADLLTGILLPPGAEANPVVIQLGLPLAVVGKLAVMTSAVAVIAYIDRRLAASILAFGLVIGLIGFASNLLVLA